MGTKILELNEDQYLNEYNFLLSRAASEYKSSFAFIASPTLSKQETVTDLYNECINRESLFLRIKKTIFLFFLFPVKLIWHLYNLLYISRSFRIKSLPEGSIYIRTWLVPRCFSGLGINDEYFHEIHEEIKKKYSVITAFQPYGYRIIDKLKQINLEDDQIIPIGLLSFGDIIKCIWEYIVTAKIKLKLNNQFPCPSRLDTDIYPR